MANPSPTIQKLEQRKAQLDARLAAARLRQAKIARSLDTRRKILVGAAILEARATDPQLGQWLARTLDGFLKRDPDRLACRDLLSMESHPQDQHQQNPQNQAAG